MRGRYGLPRRGLRSGKRFRGCRGFVGPWPRPILCASGFSGLGGRGMVVIVVGIGGGVMRGRAALFPRVPIPDGGSSLEYLVNLAQMKLGKLEDIRLIPYDMWSDRDGNRVCPRVFRASFVPN